MADHSPEPWSAQPTYSGPEWPSDGNWLIHSGPWHVATVHQHRPGGNAEDDAHLIKAAPALLRSCRLQQALIEQLLPHVARMKLDDFELLSKAPLEASHAIRMAAGPSEDHRPHEADAADNTSDIPPAESEAITLADASRKMLAVLKILLPVAQQFERQASQGTAGRRGGELFAQARHIIREAEGVTP